MQKKDLSLRTSNEMSRLYISCALLILCHSHWCLSANILAVFHFPSHSHFVIGEALCKGLAAKGHSVTVISSFPQKIPIENYHDVFIETMPSFDDIMTNSGYNLTDFVNWPYSTKIKFYNHLGYTTSKYTLEDENVKKLIRSKKVFDVVLLEHFVSESLHGFCDFYKAHCVLVSSISSSIWTNRITGNVALASIYPSIFTKYTSNHMTFFQRIDNLICLIVKEFYFYYELLPKQSELLKKHFPNSNKLGDLIYNVSLVLINSHPVITGNVPITSNIKPIAGIHLSADKINEKKIPEDVKKFLDNNEDVIYFALGSLMKSKDLPKETLIEIIETFKLWKKPILWKYEDQLPNKPENVMIAKWIPQSAVLAHKNVKAFITHCGRLSTIEAVYLGVPMIALPIFAEQLHNAVQMTHSGCALTLDYQSLNRSSFYKALIEITTNPRYKEELKLRSQILQDFKALDEGIYWIEHIIKFNGANYLKNEGINMVWYKLWMVDVIFSLILIFFTSTMGFLYLFLMVTKKNVSIKIKKS